ncbi:hypothetical protein ACGFNU_21460 [Spirillospora sp. NPDC048911]|uniref:hypothetical protein n=1 Tax=Spirillospora sp. NPDC048911 TaxID=3364527 RepID=UPI003720BADD
MTDDLRDRIAEAAKNWSLAYPIDAWQLGPEDHREKLASNWGEGIAHAVVPLVQPRLDRLVELENALDWQTSCTNCARILDGAIAERERAEKAEALLRELVDEGPCYYDHHGQCQGHNLGYWPCEHARAKELLAALDQREETA